MKPETVRRRSPLSWVPTVYFAMGLPFILVNMVSTLMFRGLGIDDARIVDAQTAEHQRGDHVHEDERQSHGEVDGRNPG